MAQDFQPAGSAANLTDAGCQVGPNQMITVGPEQVITLSRLVKTMSPLLKKGRTVRSRGDHHQVIDHNEPVVRARTSD
jgi:hypothetical protein